MRALVLADCDDLRWRGPPGKADVVISCGDVAESLLREAAAADRCSQILAVKGNHDPGGPFGPGIADLHRNRIELSGVSFGGFNGSWKYKPKGHFLYEQAEAARLLAGFPPVDVFVAHNSPSGIHDREDDVHHGFTAFVTYILDKRPRLFLHGHQHVAQETVVQSTRVVGVYGPTLVEI